MDRMLETKRQDALDALTDAFARDLIDADEYGRRASEVQSALDTLSLDRAVSDILPVPVSAAGSAARPVLRAESGSQSCECVLGERVLRGNWLRGDIVSFKTIMGESKADFSSCAMPERKLALRSHTVMGRTVFDFGDLPDIPCRVVIDLRVIMGECEMIVPRGIPVTVETSPVLGEVRIREGVSRDADPRAPGILVLGKVVMGELLVRTR